MLDRTKTVRFNQMVRAQC